MLKSKEGACANSPGILAPPKNVVPCTRLELSMRIFDSVRPITNHFVAGRVRRPELAWPRRLLSCIPLLIALSVSAIAVPAWSQGPGWTTPSTVRNLVVVSDGGVNVRLTTDLTGCASNGGYGSLYASIYPSHVGINRMKALLSLAYATNTPVSLYLSDTTCRVTEIVLGA